jgi:hypothetical protein
MQFNINIALYGCILVTRCDQCLFNEDLSSEYDEFRLHRGVRYIATQKFEDGFKLIFELRSLEERGNNAQPYEFGVVGQCIGNLNLEEAIPYFLNFIWLSRLSCE